MREREQFELASSVWCEDWNSILHQLITKYNIFVKRIIFSAIKIHSTNSWENQLERS